MVDWLANRGAHVHPELELFGEHPSRGRGVFALAPIRKGELLLAVPRSAVVCACEESDSSSRWLPAEARAMSPMVRTALVLMREEALGDASSWAPYLSLLPRSYDTLENWSPVEIERLRGTAVYDHLAGLRDASGDLVGAARLVYDKQIGRVVREHPDLWPDPSLGAFLRACAAVRTRGFHDAGAAGCGPYMLPAIDMLNHARAGTATALLVERPPPGVVGVVVGTEGERASGAGGEAGEGGEGGGRGIGGSCGGCGRSGGDGGAVPTTTTTPAGQKFPAITAVSAEYGPSDQHM
uniref:SET domain-containing protein n=1 Tax=Emiliania huxleyi TaxID=2903 RepID=A0A7S3X245_EMIHU